MRVLVVGSGGREHALAWRIAASPSTTSVAVMPGNPGIAQDPRCTVIPEKPTVTAILSQHPDLVIIGPEAPLVAGLADELRAEGIAVVGPSRGAARLEGSKEAAKELMDRWHIPTAAYHRCVTPEEARAAVTAMGAPVVVKADGLAAGKGVAVCATMDEAYAAIEKIMVERAFGAAGDTVVVEEFLSGFEASVIVLIDESGSLTLPTARDHKQIFSGNRGPNTGGMGAVAPNPALTRELMNKIDREVVQPSVVAIQDITRQDSTVLFRGFLFIGLMIHEETVSVLEYNVRFGDPEAQAILPLMGGDVTVLFHALATGTLADGIPRSGYHPREGAVCAVVAASAGYPEAVQDGVPVAAAHRGDMFFWAGVGERTGETGVAELVTSGGRVCAVAAYGETLATARRDAYQQLLRVQFAGMQYRDDIGGPSVLGEILEESEEVLLQFAKRGGILPVVVQDVASNDVLMLGYANEEAVAETVRSGLATFYSTSRQELWTKGLQSGDTLGIEEIRVDCDQDALLYRVHIHGHGVCHTREDRDDAKSPHRRRCFYRALSPGSRTTLTFKP